jgi:hypothetical protein
MARKSDEFDLDEYANEVLKESKVSDEDKAVFRRVLADEPVKVQVARSSISHAHYSRRQQDLAAAEKAMEEEKAKWTQWYDRASAEDAAIKQQADLATKEAAEAKRLADLYRSTYGELEGNTMNTQPATPQLDPNLYVSRKDYEAALARVQEDGLTLMMDANNMSLRYIAEFGAEAAKDLNWHEVVKEARTKGMRLEQAFEAAVTPKREDRLAAKHKEEIAKAREEGRMDALKANPQLPTVPFGTDIRQHPLDSSSNADIKAAVPGQLWKLGLDKLMKGELKGTDAGG